MRKISTYCHTALNYFINSLITAPAPTPLTIGTAGWERHTRNVTSNLINEVATSLQLAEIMRIYTI